MRRIAFALPLLLCCGCANLFGVETGPAVDVSEKRLELHEGLAEEFRWFLRSPKVTVPADVRDRYLAAIATNVGQYEELAAADLAWLDEVAEGVLTGDGIDWKAAWDRLREKLRERLEDR